MMIKASRIWVLSESNPSKQITRIYESSHTPTTAMYVQDCTGHDQLKISKLICRVSENHYYIWHPNIRFNSTQKTESLRETFYL